MVCVCVLLRWGISAMRNEKLKYMFVSAGIVIVHCFDDEITTRTTKKKKTNIMNLYIYVAHSIFAIKSKFILDAVEIYRKTD